MNTTTDQPDVGLSVAPTLGVTDPPDPESHEPPRHLDSSEEVPALDDGDIDPDDAMPTEDDDGRPAGVAIGQDGGDDDLDPWADAQFEQASDANIRQREDHTRALMEAEKRWPNAQPVDRETWARVVANMFVGVILPDGVYGLEAKLNATNANRAAASDESVDVLEELVREADALPEDPDESEPRRSEWDEPERGTARVIPEDGVSEPFARRAGDILRLPTSESIIYPMEFRAAERILRHVFPEMSENRRCICAYALSGYTSWLVKDSFERVDIDLVEVEAWYNEVLEIRRQMEETAEAIKEAAERAVEDRLTHAMRGFTAELEIPWYKRPEGIAVIGAVALVILLFGALVVKEERELSRFEERRDVAAEKIGTVYNKDGKLVEIKTAEELAKATGFSEDPAARDVEFMVASSSHESRLRVIETRRAELAEDRDAALATATLETDRRVRTETAFEALEEVRRQEQAEYGLRARELEGKLSRAERLLGVAASDVEAARVLYKDHVRTGRCGNPLDVDYPSDSGINRAHYKCDFGLVVCDGRLPSQADNCRRVGR